MADPAPSPTAAAAATRPPSRAGAAAPAPKNYRRTWLILTETSDPALSLPSLRAAYRTLLDAAAEAAAPAPRDAEAFDLIERDVARTFGGSAGLAGQPARDALRRLLAAYALLDREIGYVQSMNFLAGFIVLTFMQQQSGSSEGGGGGGGEDATATDAAALPALSPDDEADAFALFVRLMRGPGYDMRRFFVPGMGGVPVMSFVISQAIRAHLPAIGSHLESVGVDPVFIMEWYLTLFTYILPPGVCAEVWELFFADGWVAVVKVVLELLRHAGPHMLGRDFNATVRALKGYQHDRIRADFRPAGTAYAAAVPHSPPGRATVQGGSSSGSGDADAPPSASMTDDEAAVAGGLLRWMTAGLLAPAPPAATAAAGGGADAAPSIAPAPAPAAPPPPPPAAAPPHDSNPRARVRERLAALAGPDAAARMDAAVGAVASRAADAARTGGAFLSGVLDRLLAPPPPATAAAAEPPQQPARSPTPAAAAAAAAPTAVRAGDAMLGVRRYSSADVFPDYFDGSGGGSEEGGSGSSWEAVSPPAAAAAAPPTASRPDGEGEEGAASPPPTPADGAAASAAHSLSSSSAGGGVGSPAGGSVGSDAVFALEPPPDLVARARRLPLTRRDVEELAARGAALAADEARWARARAIQAAAAAAGGGPGGRAAPSPREPPAAPWG